MVLSLMRGKVVYDEKEGSRLEQSNDMHHTRLQRMGNEAEDAHDPESSDNIQGLLQRAVWERPIAEASISVEGRAEDRVAKALDPNQNTELGYTLGGALHRWHIPAQLINQW